VGEHIDAERVAVLWQDAWEAARGPTGAHPELRAHGEQTLRRYIESAAWAAAPLREVEAPFILGVDAGQISGRFDRVDVDESGVPTVVDYKTGPPPGEDGASRDLQVRAYAVALAQRQRTDSCAVELHHLQTTEVTRVEFDERTLRRAFGHISATATDLMRAWEDNEFPPNPAPWRCRRCDYRTVCDERAE
jgi:CRISPR/Cas system-associated exonuclease Cas4 (RecB family)